MVEPGNAVGYVRDVDVAVADSVHEIVDHARLGLQQSGGGLEPRCARSPGSRQSLCECYRCRCRLGWKLGRSWVDSTAMPGQGPRSGIWICGDRSGGRESSPRCGFACREPEDQDWRLARDRGERRGRRRSLSLSLRVTSEFAGVTRGESGSRWGGNEGQRGTRSSGSCDVC